MRIEATTHSMRVDTRSNRPFELKPLSRLKSARIDQRRQNGLREDRDFIYWSHIKNIWGVPRQV
jgi:hypothetical protein